MDLGGKNDNRIKDVADRVAEFEQFCAGGYLSYAGLFERAQYLSWDDVRESSFLHKVCMNGSASLGAVQALLEIYPKAASIPARWDCCGAGVGHCADYSVDTKEAFPIHAACRNESCPDSVIRLLLAENPTALSKTCVVDMIINDTLDDPLQDDEFEYFPVGGLPLHQYFLRSPPSHIMLDTVKLLIEAYPVALTTARGDDGATPLLTLLWNQNVSELLDIIKYVLEFNPSCIRIPDGRGRLPIHVACLNDDTDIKTFELLLKTWPDSTLQADNRLCLPIHLWCHCRGNSGKADEALDLRTLNLFIQTSPASVRQGDGGGQLAISYLVARPKLFQCLLDEFPESVAVQMRGDLLIHRACRKGVVDTVEQLFQIYPESIKIRDHKGGLPIHCAADSGNIYTSSNGGQVEMIRYLLSRCPGSASEATTQCGRLPLHFASSVDWFADSIVMTIALFDAYPEAICKKDGNGDTPVDSVQKSKNEESKKFLQTNLVHAQRAADPEAMTTRDLNGQLPLHVALHDNLALGAVKLLVKGNPAALEVSDHQGSFPLHVACHRGKCDVVKYVLNANASPVSELNGDKKLPIHLLFESEEVDHHSIDYVDTVWSLLCAYPESISDWVPQRD